MPQSAPPQQFTEPRSSRRVLYCFIASLLFVCIVPTVCITLALRLHPGGELSYVRDPVSDGLNRAVYLHAVAITADISRTTTLVDRDIVMDTCVTSNCTEVNIFFDTDLFPDAKHEDSSYSNNKPTNPIFVWNVTDLNIGMDAYLSRDNDPTFLTELIIYPEYDYTQHALDRSHASLVYYPFDRMPSSTLLSSPTFSMGLVTLMICLIMIATVVFGFRQRNEIVVVPIGTVFAFNQLRSSMPGAPDGFGDILGTDRSELSLLIQTLLRQWQWSTSTYLPTQIIHPEER
ncbi:hypothetical protein IW261DRAFT_1420635 [Armillaria novae-zelandiae]|uniref:Uncharacterized protein n=1 Tax=Armillaria novae-zelandiae TaxID=153914 RepID=A0AA39P609_9AGAR|nr:hypothetical protein IW261DRAFT_1420635 [Armillaria novae-zelandiae]